MKTRFRLGAEYATGPRTHGLRTSFEVCGHLLANETLSGGTTFSAVRTRHHINDRKRTSIIRGLRTGCRIDLSTVIYNNSHAVRFNRRATTSLFIMTGDRIPGTSCAGVERPGPYHTATADACTQTGGWGERDVPPQHGTANSNCRLEMYCGREFDPFPPFGTVVNHEITCFRTRRYGTCSTG